MKRELSIFGLFLVIRRIMGTKKTLTFIGLVVVMATATGLVFGMFTGS